MLSGWSALDITSRILSLVLFIAAFGAVGLPAVLIFVATRVIWHRIVDKEWSKSAVFLCMTDLLRWVRADWTDKQVLDQMRPLCVLWWCLDDSVDHLLIVLMIVFDAPMILSLSVMC